MPHKTGVEKAKTGVVKSDNTESLAAKGISPDIKVSLWENTTISFPAEIPANILKSFKRSQAKRF